MSEGGNSPTFVTSACSFSPGIGLSWMPARLTSSRKAGSVNMASKPRRKAEAISGDNPGGATIERPTSAALANAELYQRVALERERSVAILANIAEGIVAVDRDGKVVLWNSAAESITGVPASVALDERARGVRGADRQ